MALDVMPMWGVFVFALALVLISIELGFRLGRWHRKHAEHEAEGAVGAVAAAVVGLLALLQAFTFGNAAERFQARRELLLNEVNAIGTTYLRAELLPEPHGSQVRDLLREYVDVRVEAGRDRRKIKTAIEASESLQTRLWSHATALAHRDFDSPIGALFIASLNEMIDLHTKRVTVGRYRIPTAIWSTLGALTFLSMLLAGYYFGLCGPRSLPVACVLALSFAGMVLLNTDLDRPSEGTLRVSHQPMLELQQQMSGR